MAHLLYSVIASLDGYVNDVTGSFEWAAPDAEVHAFMNEQERSVGTHLYGRRLYEVMVAWETMDDEDPVMRDYADIWRAADKVVFSSTLDAVSSARTRLERRFDPDAVRAMVADADRDVAVGGPGLAAHAIRAGLVDEYSIVTVPVVVGGGTNWLPPDVRVDLELVEEKRFDGGFVFLRYRASTANRKL